MKKILLILTILSGVFLIAGMHIHQKQNPIDVQLYYTDSSMLRLIPSDFKTDTSNKSKAAKIVIQELLRGRDDNKKILRIMPDVKNGLSVKIKENTAIVNLSSEFVRLHPNTRQHELLTIYSIVNSLTSIKGITKVKFTINDKEEKDFKGFCDMRETFIPDYYI